MKPAHAHIQETIKSVAEHGDQLVYIMCSGFICATWQQIEANMERTIWHWAGLSKKRGMCLTGRMQFPLLCETLLSLAHVRFANPDYDKALTKLIQNRLKPAKAVRDRFAHALWEPLDGQSNIILERPHRTNPEKHRTAITVKEITGAQLKVIHAPPSFRRTRYRFCGQVLFA